MKLLSFGEILWDVYPDSKAIGGASLNLAAHAALLGAEVDIASAIGNDALGKEAIDVLKTFGVKTEHISVLDEKDTGSVVVTLNEDKIPSYEIMDDVAYDYIHARNSYGHYDAIVFGTLAIRHNHNKEVLTNILNYASAKEIYCDLNVRLPHSTKESAMLCFSKATIIKVSDEELPIISKWILGEVISPRDFAFRISTLYKNVKLIIVTMGERGSFCYERKTDSFTFSDGVATEVVSTVGAGDSFGAAFLTKYFSNSDIKSCLEFASLVSSFVCSRKDAVPTDMPF